MFQYSDAEKLWLPISLGIIILICIILGFALKGKSEKVKRIPQMLIAIIILVLEVIKQIYHIVLGDYTTWYIPLHFCSLFLFFYPLAEFSRGRVRECGQALAFITSFMFVACFYLMPSGVIGTSTERVFTDFNAFHTYFYHHLVILYFGLTLTLRTYTPKYKHALYVWIGLTAYFAVAVSMSFILNENYCNILTCSIDFIENWRLTFGHIPYLIGMYAFGITLGCAGMLLISWIYKIILKKVRWKELNKI